MHTQQLVASLTAWCGHFRTAPAIASQFSSEGEVVDLILGATWQNSANVRSEFMTKEGFMAFGRHEARRHGLGA